MLTPQFAFHRSWPWPTSGPWPRQVGPAFLREDPVPVQRIPFLRFFGSFLVGSLLIFDATPWLGSAFFVVVPWSLGNWVAVRMLFTCIRQDEMFLL